MTGISTDSDTGWLLSLAAKAWRNAVDVGMADLGLTQSRWIAMMHLRRLGEGSTQSELAADIGIERPSMVRTLNQLEAAGLIERRPSEHDGRSRTLWFTSAGQRLLGAMESRAAAGREVLMIDMSADERQQLRNLLTRITANSRRLVIADQTPFFANGASSDDA